MESAGNRPDGSPFRPAKASGEQDSVPLDVGPSSGQASDQPSASAPPQASVTVVIVNRNGADHLLRCLSCLAAQRVLPERILLVDNASTDGSFAAAEAFIRTDPRLARLVTLSSWEENIGFAAANNRAVAESRSDYVALLNPDAFAEPGWLEALLDAARLHPEAAAFGSLQLLEGFPGRLDGVGDVYHMTGLAWRDGHSKERGDRHSDDGEIFSACAAAALYRRSVFLELGGFDEDFFCYFEDVDLGFRLRLAGYTARNVSAAVVSHVGGVSTAGEPGDFAVYHGHRNLVWCFWKNMPVPLFPLLLPLHLAACLYNGVAFTGRGRGRAIGGGLWHAFRGLPGALRKRRTIQSARRATVASLWRQIDRRLWPPSRDRRRLAEAVEQPINGRYRGPAARPPS